MRRAASGEPVEAENALATLCQAYWYPLYSFIRRTGKSAEDAEDSIQGFFLHLLKRDVIVSADRAKGRLRTFFVACLKNYLADDHSRAMAQKRGAALLTGLDIETAEQRYRAEPVDDYSPDRLFQRRWAMTVLADCLVLLEEEYRTQGKGELFAALRPFLGFGPEPETGYAEISKNFGMAVGTAKNHVFRLRARWRELLFEQVALTLSDPTPEEIRSELAELCSSV